MSARPQFRTPQPAGPGQGRLSGPAPLSLMLRQATQSLHQQVEAALGLPGAIRSLSDYTRWLSRFYQFYQPFEGRLAAFVEWPSAGVDLAEYGKAASLRLDLAALGVAPEELAVADAASLPVLPHFASAFGALYVVEGSALGSQYILEALRPLLGEAIVGADTFFRGRGPETAGHWQRFRALLDSYGAHSPDRAQLAIEGASATFRAIGRWMQP